MYEELKAKCETFKADILEVLPDLTEGGCLKDIKAEAMYNAIHAAGNGVDRILNTIEAYYKE
jgi:hypothetical protein